MKEWAEAILETINFLGNEASLQQIYASLEEHFPLSEHNTRTTPYGGRPAYQHEVRSFVSNLVEGGDLKRVGRGRYRLTSQGLGRLEDWLRADGRSLHEPVAKYATSSPRSYLLNVEVEPLDEGGYLAIAKDLQGAHAEGETIAEAIDNLEDVARIIIELCRREGLPLPPEFEGPGPTPIVKAEVLVRVA